MSQTRFTQLVTELSSHAGLGPMAAEILARGESAYLAQDSVFPRPGSRTLGQPGNIATQIALVGDLDLRQILEFGARSSEDLDLLSALMLLGTAASWPTEPSSQQTLARRLLWLETHSALRCLSSAGAILDGARLKDLGFSLLQLLESPDQELRPLTPAERAVGRAWLMTCAATECRSYSERAQALEHVANAVGASNLELRGDLGPKPRHGLLTALLAMTTLLFIDRAARAAGRYTLSFRSPAHLRLSERGLELTFHRELLGRVLKERKHLIPLSEIRQVLREVRYPRLGLYAGLAALTLGTLFGMRVFVDGLRVAGVSFVMMAWGAGFIVLGLGLDLLLTGLSDGAKGKCRLVVRTRNSGGFALGALNPTEVDSMLTELSSRLAER